MSMLVPGGRMIRMCIIDLTMKEGRKADKVSDTNIFSTSLTWLSPTLPFGVRSCV
jgi:hypothetical protein